MSGSLSTAVNKPVDGRFDDTAEKAAVHLWTRAIERLKARLSRHTFQTYFEPIKPVSLHAGELTLAHSSKFMIDWVRDNLLDVLLQDLEAQHGAKCTVKFVVRERPGTEAEGEAPSSAQQQRAEITANVATTSPGVPVRPPTLNTKYTFDSFVVGPSNQFAVAACTAVANAPGKAYNPLFLYGGVGLGKTHLVHAVGSHALKANPNCHVLYLSSEAFTNDLIHALEGETRVAILKKKAATDNIHLPDDVALFLGSHIRSNVRELEGSLIRLAAFASLTKSSITVDLAKDVLKTVLVVRGDKPDVEQIIRAVGEQMQVRPQDIKGDRRQQGIARARQVAMYLTRRITGLSYPAIGEKFGGKDHSTVINAEQRIEQLMRENDELRVTVESLLRRLNG